MNLHRPIQQKIFDLSALGTLQVSGQGAQALLQGQLSVDLNKLPAGSGAFGAHCNPQGRIISLFYLFNTQEHYLLVMPSEILGVATQALKKYAPFFKADVCDASGKNAIIGTIDAPPPDSVAVYSFPDSERHLCVLKTLPVTEMGSLADWQELNIRDGIPELSTATSSEFLPHDLNLPALQAISFDKGCFTGQEIIARMHYRGKPKNHLYHGYVKHPQAPGSPLFVEGKPAGTVINCSHSMYNDYYALLFVASETTVSQDNLQTESGLPIELQKSE
jgi:tRNA-modifying protein YgfZ